MAEWITKRPKKMVDKKTTAKWIEKKPKKMVDKETTAKWITKKPTKWITKKERPLKDKLRSASIEGFIESTKDTVHPLKGDRVAGRGEKKLTVKTHPKTSKSTYTLSNRGTTGTNWRAGKDRIDKWVKSGDAEKNYKKTGKLFTNYSGKMKKTGYKGGGAVLKGKKVGIQIK